jgi:hypothetical protein
MILPFEHIEVIDQAEFTAETSNLNLARNLYPKLALIRGIMGSIRIKHTISQIEFDQTVDYLDLQGRNAGKNPLEKFKDYISEEITVADLDGIFGDRIFLLQNQKFFERLTQEFNNYYFYQNRRSFTTAFAFIYRILETISYAFPLIYATKTNDFRGTYTLLKDYMSGNKDKGELGFFKSFIKVLFETDPAVNSSITINIYGDTEEIQQKFFSSIIKACPDQNIYDAADTDEPRKLSVKFTEYSSFIINLRNRFFHLFNSGQPNLQSDDILDADAFFYQFNEKSIYWISLILLEIIKNNLPRVRV